MGQKTIKFTKEENQKIHEGACYKLNPENDTLKIEYSGHFKYSQKVINKASGLISKYGERGVENLGFLYVILYVVAIVSILIPCNYYWKTSGLFIGLLFALPVAFMFIMLADDCTNVAKYYRDAKCKKCGKDLALLEYRKPEIEEISTIEDYTVTVTRYWKCKFCGQEDIRKGPENFTTRKGYRNEPPDKKCENCGKELTIIEYRNPDIKVNDDEITTLKHYKCESCGYREIKIKKEYLPSD